VSDGLSAGTAFADTCGMVTLSYAGRLIVTALLAAALLAISRV
jgi:hypothetical protein